MKPALGLLLAVASACHAGPTAPTTPAATPITNRDPLAAKIDALAAEAVATGATVGVTIAIAHHGAIDFVKGYGTADILGKKPADADTVYRIGSLTKQFTAAAIVQLSEAGKLALTDDISRYVPDVPTAGNKVTIEQLLHHTSGMPNYTGLDAFQAVIASHMTPAELVALVKDVKWDFPAGTAWNYSNTGYVVLGMIIEKVSGETYPAYVAKHVFPAAGLVATTYCDETVPNPHRAIGYELAAGKPVLAKPIDFSTPYAAGSICSTAPDLLRWNAALAGGRVVSHAGYVAMTTSHGFKDNPYGLGLALDPYKGHRSVSHNGGIPGFVGELHDYVDDGVTIAVLTNTEAATAATIQLAIAALELAIPSEAVAISAADLAPFVGVYVVEPIGDLVVAVDGDHLSLTPTGQPTFALEFRGKDTFAIDAIAAMLTFERDPATQAVIGVSIRQHGGTFGGKRKP